VLPLRAVGAPIKSSIELAWVKVEDGRRGGPLELPGGVGIDAPVETDRGRGGGASPEIPGLEERGAALDEEGGRLPEADIGGSGGTGGAPFGGMLPELVVRLGGRDPLGGGGVARTGAALPGSFLLTHFFKSLS
jgi:hypothetical protein